MECGGKRNSMAVKIEIYKKKGNTNKMKTSSGDNHRKTERLDKFDGKHATWNSR